MMMRPLSRDSEIIETKELFPDTQSKTTTFSKSKLYDVVGIKCGSPVQNDLIRLFDALDIKTPSRSTGHSYHGADSMQRKAWTRNAMVNAARGSRIGVSESVNLKKALRRLCVSQASEMAAMKRLSKPIGLSGVSEAGTIKRLYSTIILGAGEIGEKEEDMLAISLIPKKKIFQSPKKEVASYQMPSIISSNGKIVKPRTHYAFALSGAKAESKISASVKSRSKGKVRCGLSSGKDAIRYKASGHNTTPPPTKPAFKRKRSSKMEEKHCQSPTTCIPGMNNASDRVDIITIENKQERTYESAQVPNFGIMDTLSRSKGENSLISKLECTPSNSSAGRVVGTRTGRSSKSKTKGEYSHSSKSSLGDFSSSTSTSNESSSGFGSRPHMSKDLRWLSIRNAERQHGKLGLRNFTLLKRLGCGDIGTVYLSELTGSETLFALKIMDNDYLVSRKKMLRAETEREILQMLDHPFLPTLYTHFTSDNLSCLVMEYCPGGDLHVLRQQQSGRSFTEPAARFYVAEVLLALEYLHMLGVIYRDLKPENILVREDGHIMLSDFDLSLRCAVNPTLLRSSSLAEAEAAYRPSGPCSVSSCIDPLCLQPSWVHVSCFTSHPVSKNKVKSDFGAQPRPLPQLVAEPTEARSNSFVGTHEYLAPEIIKGEGHGSSVDWWTLGIFLYELLFGRTPFKGIGNEETLTNIVCESLMFPECPNVSFHAIDLIRGLLVKEPENRLGSVKGAAEIKQHVFFRGLNWALIRCAIPPEVPASCDLGLQAEDLHKKEGTCSEFSGFKSNIDFELF